MHTMYNGTNNIDTNHFAGILFCTDVNTVMCSTISKITAVARSMLNLLATNSCLNGNMKHWRKENDYNIHHDSIGLLILYTCSCNSHNKCIIDFKHVRLDTPYRGKKFFTNVFDGLEHNLKEFLNCHNFTIDIIVSDFYNIEFARYFIEKRNYVPLNDKLNVIRYQKDIVDKYIRYYQEDKPQFFLKSITDSIPSSVIKTLSKY
ncbi:hypothetical protein QKU58_gp167 [Pyramimonas orientalis virus]|uniref:Uncharacterized protein n=1 Tax=Pyramimonas orientalis virus 01B TaxID=3134525 RepID=A0A7M4CEQ8_9VIRU|nr:hypothetical protein QKU58_gp167 [Pyramimonas orientalis virus]QOI90164.1 hypothetical protein HWQ62_00027 [Pyramimonas orientalis virus]